MLLTRPLCLTVTLLLAGCGGEDGSSSASPESTSTTDLNASDPLGDLTPDEIIPSMPSPSSGGGSSGTGSIPQNETQACGVSQSGLVAEPVVLELLVDTSRSMTEAPGGGDDTSAESKWVITRRALGELLPTLSQDLALGLSFYPGTSDLGSACLVKHQAVEIAPLGASSSPARAAFEHAINSAHPDGGTPTHEAYVFGVDQLLESSAQGKKYLLLITDGIPTFEMGCQNFDRNGVNTAPLIQAAADAYAQGVNTFVIGSPGSENARTSLSQIARAGGTATDGCSDEGPNYCHFDMTQDDDLGAALTTAFGNIASSITSCEYRVPMGDARLDPSKVNVLLQTQSGADESVGRDPSETACTTGWQYSDDKQRILLCGETCDRVKNDPTLHVQVLFGCETQRAPQLQ